jgi:hypothetical protein
VIATQVELRVRGTFDVSDLCDAAVVEPDVGDVACVLGVEELRAAKHEIVRLTHGL